MNKTDKKKLETLLKKGWKAMHEANQQLIKGCDTQGLELLVDLYTLADKLVTVYEAGSLAQLEEAK